MHEYDQEDYIEVTPDIKEENTYENGEMPSEFNEEIFSDDIEAVTYENESVNPETNNQGKVEKIEEDDLDSIPKTSPSVKIQIIGGKVYLR